MKYEVCNYCKNKSDICYSEKSIKAIQTGFPPKLLIICQGEHGNYFSPIKESVCVLKDYKFKLNLNSSSGFTTNPCQAVYNRNSIVVYKSEDFKSDSLKNKQIILFVNHLGITIKNEMKETFYPKSAVITINRFQDDIHFHLNGGQHFILYFTPTNELYNLICRIFYHRPFLVPVSQELSAFLQHKD